MLQSAMITHVEQEHVACTACGMVLHAEEAQYDHPLITARQLVRVGTQAAIRSPKLFGELMLNELPLVPYCTACRQQLPAKRQTEQLKFMMGVLFLIALVISVLFMVGASM